MGDYKMKDKIDRAKLLDAIAPCAFCCFTCAARKNGIIEETARTLNHYFEGYYDFNRKNLPFRYRNYSKKIKEFTEQLEKFSDRPCNGCRSGANQRCCIPDCFIEECTRSHKVDFCGECDEFPCSRALAFFKGENLQEWKSNNEKIRQSTPEEFYESAVSKSHYLHFRSENK